MNTNQTPDNLEIIASKPLFNLDDSDASILEKIPQTSIFIFYEN